MPSAVALFALSVPPVTLIAVPLTRLVAAVPSVVVPLFWKVIVRALAPSPRAPRVSRVPAARSNVALPLRVVAPNVMPAVPLTPPSLPE